MVGYLLPAWTESKKRKAIKTGKFYFFDPGITHMLAGTQALDRNSNLYGKSFEQFICMELRAYLSYRRKKLPLTYWRSKSGHEVDFFDRHPYSHRSESIQQDQQKWPQRIKLFKGRRCIPKFNHGQPWPDKYPFQQHSDRSLAKISLRSVARQVCLKPADWETESFGKPWSLSDFVNKVNKHSQWCF